MVQKSILKSLLLNKSNQKKIISKINSDIKSAFVFAENSPFPIKSDAYKNVFAK